MAEYVDFHYLPLEGKISGMSMLKQTEDAINDLGEKVYSIDIDASEIQQALENSEQAIETANSAMATVTLNRAVWHNSVAAMIADDIPIGVTAATRGHDYANDGNGAFFVVRSEKSGDVDDNVNIIFLDNGNVAERITKFDLIARGNNIVYIENVADLRTSDGLVGMVYGTQGYYSANDGGSGLYLIRAFNDDTDDGGSIIILDNGNVAELIVGDSVIVNQFGAIGNGYYDNYIDGKDYANMSLASATVASYYDNVTTKKWYANASFETEGTYLNPADGKYYVSYDVDTDTYTTEAPYHDNVADKWYVTATYSNEANAYVDGTWYYNATFTTEAHDDTDAFDNAIAYAAAHGLPIQLLKGTYIIASRHVNTHPHLIPTNGSFVINGVGTESVIKRKSRSVTGDTQSLFVVKSNTSNTNNVALVQFSNLFIDSNARNNTPANSGYTYEHCADVRINGILASKINNVIINNVWATDGVADHFYFPASGNAYVNTVTINGFFVDYRNRTRSDICVTGYVQNMIVSNIKCVVFEYEYNTAPSVVTGNLVMTNCVLERLDLIGWFNMQLSNVTTTVDSCFRNMTGIVTNSVFAHRTVEWERLRNIRFDNCIFNLNGITDSSYLEIEEYATISFVNCSFNVMNDGGAYRLIHKDLTSSQTLLEFDNCKFDAKAEIAISWTRAKGTLIVRNCEFSNARAIHLYSASSYPGTFVFTNVRFKGGTISHSLDMHNATLIMDNVVVEDLAFAKAVQSSSAWATGLTNKGGRTMLVTEPLTTAMFTTASLTGCFFNGDRIINTNPIPNAPNEWICRSTTYTTSASSSASKFVATGKAYGATADRPTCIMGDGFEYFDTDLKKPIYRSSSDWVDATGTVV